MSINKISITSIDESSKTLILHGIGPVLDSRAPVSHCWQLHIVVLQAPAGMGSHMKASRLHQGLPLCMARVISARQE